MTTRAGSAPLADAPPGALDARRVREFGGRPRRRGRAGRALPWLGSALAHALLAAVAFFITWTVVVHSIEEEAPVVTLMDFYAPAFEPVEPSLAEAIEAPAPERLAPVQDAPRAVPASVVASLNPRAAIAPGDPHSKPMAPLAVESRGRTATLAGLQASNAKRIVYVVGASGALTGTFPEIAHELAQSLSKLDHRQSFAVIFFQKNEALMVPPGHLMPATAENTRSAIEWFERRVFPTGRGNPLAALEAAMDLKPDLIFLLSAGVSGAGEYEIADDDLVDAIDDLNPVVSRSGRRRTRIQCVAFFDRGSVAVLERIAERHGGPGSFRFLSRDELGLTPGQRGPDGAPIVE